MRESEKRGGSGRAGLDGARWDTDTDPSVQLHYVSRMQVTAETLLTLPLRAAGLQSEIFTADKRSDARRETK